MLQKIFGINPFLVLPALMLACLPDTLPAQSPPACGVSYVPPAPADCLDTDPYGTDFECDYRRSYTGGVIDMTPTYTIPVVIHLYHNNGPENLSDDVLHRILDEINTYYGATGPAYDTKIRFALARLDPYGNCSSGIDRVQLASPDRTQSSQWHNAYKWDESRYVNIHLFRSYVGFGSTIGNASSTPNYGDKITGDAMVAINNNPNIPLAIAHELGHFLSLIHTNESCLNTDCLVNGDKVCDTEPHSANASTGQLYCEIITDCFPSLTIPWDNVMHSYLNQCSFRFTEGQAMRMRYYIEWAGLNLASEANKLCTGIHALGAVTAGGERIITGYESYTAASYPAPVQLNYSIRVRPGATLDIGAGVELRMCGDARIIVEPNGKLFLHGKLTGSCDIPWQGIEVYGTHIHDNQSYNVNPAIVPLGYKQGYIQCYPGSAIENAHTAIRLYGPDGRHGGVAYCDGLTIRNCKTGVDIDEFGMNNSTPYKATFSNCDFITDDDFPFDTDDFCGIQLTRVKGVQISSCEFINTKDRSPWPLLTDFGYGIRAVDAGFEMSRACTGFSPGSCVPGRRNRFAGLAYGVFVGRGTSVPVPSSVKSADFTGCYYGIYERGSVFQTILFNTFTLGELSHPSLVADQAGIVCEDTYSNMIIEENTFTGISGNKDDRIGIVADNMGQYTNKIRRNSFSNLRIANLVNNICGDNLRKGLKYICNTNSGNYANDFLIPQATDQLTRYQSFDIIGPLGPVDKPTLNTFSHSTPIYSDFENHNSNNIQYYYKDVASHKPLNYFNIFRMVANENPEACAIQYCELPCLAPGKDGLAFHDGANTATLKARYHALRDEYNDAKTKDPGLPDETRSAYERRLMELAADVAHYMLYDTLHAVTDSVVTWSARVESAKNGAGYLVRQDDGYSSGSMAEEKEAALEERNGIPLRQYARERSRSLQSEAQRSDAARSSYARNMLTAIGYHYPPHFHTGTEQGQVPTPAGTAGAAFGIYPNPSHGYIKIRLSDPAGTVRCTIYDGFGNIRRRSWVEAGTGSHTIDLSASLPGVYYVELSGDSGSLGVQRFILTP